MASKKSKKAAAKKAAKTAKKHPALVAVIVVLLALVIAAVAVLYLYKPEVFEGLFGTGLHETEGGTQGSGGGTGGGTGEGSGSGLGGGASAATGASEEIVSADLSIHFLELGNANAGDCTLIRCGDTEVLIDAGSKRNSTSTIKAYLDEYVVGALDYVIVTHAHEDHIAALVGESGKNNGVLYSYEIGTIIQFTDHYTNSGIYNDFVTAVSYAQSEGTNVYTALECWNETNGAKKQYYLDDEEKISINILYQKYYETRTTNENNYSVCTLLTQEIDEQTTYHYLFTGDLEKAGEESLVANNDLPKCKLFKGGHHGSSTSSNDVLLRVIQPENIAICTCAGTYEYADKPTEETPEEVTRLNTFPTQEAIDRMAKYTENIYVTTVGILKEDYSTDHYESMNGNIVFYTAGGELKLWCSHNNTILKDTEWFQTYRTWNIA